METNKIVYKGNRFLIFVVPANDTKYSGITCGILSFLKQQAVRYFVKMVWCHSERSEESNGISGLQKRFFG
jgi:hypothetical protein